MIIVRIILMIAAGIVFVFQMRVFAIYITPKGEEKKYRIPEKHTLATTLVLLAINRHLEVDARLELFH